MRTAAEIKRSNAAIMKRANLLPRRPRKVNVSHRREGGDRMGERAYQEKVAMLKAMTPEELNAYCEAVRAAG